MNIHYPLHTVVLTALAVSAFQLSVFAQGSLTPPGAPAATMKSLDQIEPRTPISSLPFTITNAGSYYLTTNLTGNPGGITISANGVTLDLMGFELVGGTGSGIVASGSRTNIAIRNGTVRNWVTGVLITNTVNSSASDLLLSQNTGAGLSGGTDMQVRNCSANKNGTGIQVGDGSTVSGCKANRNGLTGIAASGNGTIIGCTASFNGNGIDATGSGNRIEANHATFNDFGVNVPQTGNLIIRNSASANALGNFNILAGNSAGPVISGSAVATNTNPHANYTP